MSQDTVDRDPACQNAKMMNFAITHPSSSYSLLPPPPSPIAILPYIPPGSVSLGNTPSSPLPSPGPKGLVATCSSR